MTHEEERARRVPGVLITGSSSDLGRHLVAELSKAERTVVCTRRSPSPPDEVVGPGVRLLENCDLLDSAACQRVADAADQAFEGPFGVVHSVGDFWEHLPFEALPAADAQSLIDSHVGTLYRLLEKVLPVLVSKGGGSVVTFSCNSVRYSYPWMAPFTAAKSAVESLTRSLAHEYADRNVRFNALVLASLRTEKVVRSKPKGDVAHFIPPEDIAPVVEFLIGPASYLVTGNSINLLAYSERFYHQGYFERIEK